MSEQHATPQPLQQRRDSSALCGMHDVHKQQLLTWRATGPPKPPRAPCIAKTGQKRGSIPKV